MIINPKKINMIYYTVLQLKIMRYFFFHFLFFCYYAVEIQKVQVLQKYFDIYCFSVFNIYYFMIQTLDCFIYVFNQLTTMDRPVLFISAVLFANEAMDMIPTLINLLSGWGTSFLDCFNLSISSKMESKLASLVFFLLLNGLLIVNFDI